jgi:hypothetical protein
MNGTRLGSLIAATAVALTAVTAATAPTAQAQRLSEGSIKSDCKKAGGSYSTEVVGGVNVSRCGYKDAGGDQYADWYIGGEYTDTYGPL